MNSTVAKMLTQPNVALRVARVACLVLAALQLNSCVPPQLRGHPLVSTHRIVEEERVERRWQVVSKPKPEQHFSRPESSPARSSERTGSDGLDVRANSLPNPRLRSGALYREFPLWNADTRIEPVLDPPTPVDRFADKFITLVDDQRAFYSASNLTSLALGLGGAAIRANSPFAFAKDTTFDTAFRDEYLRRFYSEDGARFANDIELVGDYTLTVPILGLAALAATALPEDRGGDLVYTWSTRSIRSILVGEPALLFLQKATGAGRPEEGEPNWSPFDDDNGVSGHSFIGAIPFLAAASMTDRWYYRYPLVLASMLPAWARVNNDDHYFS
ncbi:MAG: hypothetical protein AAF517_15100, partial [Planctomycetota bacterium]